jgi:hypothetical protein
MTPINRFLLRHGLRIDQNPCISPDFCLDWDALKSRLLDPSARGLTLHPKSRFDTAAGVFSLLEDSGNGDCAWRVEQAGSPGSGSELAEGISHGSGTAFYPATWENLLRLKNIVQAHDPGSTIFPTAAGTLAHTTLGIGARFTTLHWPAVEWAMSALEISLTANQNSIPRELVYDVDAMLEGRLGTVPFPFIGTDVPEGHQGQSVEGMSHGCVLSKLRTGFHRRRIAWSFNADHQPIGGSFDSREEALVRGCLLASYITFDLSPELASGRPARASEIDTDVAKRVGDRLAAMRLAIEPAALDSLLCGVWPAVQKMKRRDEKYRTARSHAFTAPEGRRYLRELSIDEMPGITEPETTAVMLALCEALEMPVDFVAPAFGLQKNTPYPDSEGLRLLIERQWAVAREFGASVGFHSGSGKSAENYRAMGEATAGHLEIKTSGRYTYEMGVALFHSRDAGDQALWGDWYSFTAEMALAGAFSGDPTERERARFFIADSLAKAGKNTNVFASPGGCRVALGALQPSPEHMLFFEYNFLFVLAAGGRAEKAALGDHSAAGYAQRGRFYAISEEARLLYEKGVAGYIVFLAEHAGLVAAERCAAARTLLERTRTHDEFLAAISR